MAALRRGLRGEVGGAEDGEAARVGAAGYSVRHGAPSPPEPAPDLAPRDVSAGRVWRRPPGGPAWAERTPGDLGLEPLRCAALGGSGTALFSATARADCADGSPARLARRRRRWGREPSFPPPRELHLHGNPSRRQHPARPSKPDVAAPGGWDEFTGELTAAADEEGGFGARAPAHLTSTGTCSAGTRRPRVVDGTGGIDRRRRRRHRHDGTPRFVDGRAGRPRPASGYPVEVQQATGASRQRASRKERRPVRSPVWDEPGERHGAVLRGVRGRRVPGGRARDVMISSAARALDGAPYRPGRLWAIGARWVAGRHRLENNMHAKSGRLRVTRQSTGRAVTGNDHDVARRVENLRGVNPRGSGSAHGEGAGGEAGLRLGGKQATD
ncbi:hypothetical protein THAOC_33217 [Thalassiosira oceanica]|uniref:Uncharacterized protein n=1 Tax=Thalassiosira oceanica TaxID=159749 RepID=K0R7J0_THAOC|nr:hypothetical protein THAOC_33217 [Thalassiosira oceanica]|eukprot:EJK48024.1 hypothetical protein THAOC_33217 [Thalassiosira oceanica]